MYRTYKCTVMYVWPQGLDCPEMLRDLTLEHRLYAFVPPALASLPHVRGRSNRPYANWIAEAVEIDGRLDKPCRKGEPVAKPQPPAE